MKRSRMIRLVLIGSTGLVALGACDAGDPVLGQGDFFSDARQCAAKLDQDACRQGLADARAQHVATAPKFTTRPECEAKFGEDNCQLTDVPAGTPIGQGATSQGGSWFMPVMLGYMMGRTAGGAFAPTPLYRDASNTAYTGARRLGRLDPKTVPPMRGLASAPAAQRGGFGATGANSSSAS
jgi:uncharacterized protein YgiB involved in biofilm formation